MRCGACHTENAGEGNFCSRCGRPLRQPCAACGHANDPDGRFCGRCGRPLTPAVAEAEPARRIPAGGERRQLTVLFCDIVGSTQLAARLDPEDWYAVAARYQQCAAKAVERFGGHIAQFQGDGFLTYFGYPLVYDDSPERGVRAALGMLDALERLNAELTREHGIRIAVRIGIHTGEVVLAPGGRDETDLFGEAVHLTARVQHLGGPDEIVVTDPTCRLVRGLFLMEERGVHDVAGFHEPVSLYRVVAPTGVRGRLSTAPPGGLTPFVGRDAERSLLASRWERVRDAHGQVVLVSGEPGLGKSRLLQVFRDDIAGTPHTWIECTASSYHEQTPFFCVADMLQQALTRQCGDAVDEQLGLLDRAVGMAGLDPARAVPLVAEMIGLVPPAGRYPEAAGEPAERRHRLLTTLVQWVLGAAAAQPLVLVVEDLMWADPSTLELLELLAHQVPTAPVLLLYTARPEFRSPWPPRSNFLTVTLNRLSREEVRRMITSGAAASTSTELVDALAERSDGVPLFAEELTRLMKDARQRFAENEIPATLHDLLMTRLDRVGPARRIAQIGAVIGREFSYELLAAVAGAPGPDLDAALTRLADAELLHARGFPPDASYVFKHALIRDAAYASLLKSRRRELHLAIARALASRDVAEAPPELLAHHYTEANEIEAAWQAWRQAGESAVARSALREAAEHFATALRLLGTLPDAPGRARQALDVQILYGQALAATKGYGAGEVIDAFDRARELAQQAGATPELRAVLFGLWASIAGKGELRVADELADELLGMGERSGVRGELVWGHLARGVNRYSRGECVGARKDLARGVALYRESDRPPSPSDPGVMALSYAAVNSWALGLFDEARSLSREALALARALRNPFADAWAGLFTGVLHVSLREPGRAMEHTDPLLATCREHKFSLFVGLLTIVRGAALAEDGRHAEGCRELRDGLELYRATGQRVSHRLYLSWLAQACLAAGSIDEAAAAVDEGFAVSPEEHLCEPELHRLRAEILAGRRAEPATIEASYREAIALAARQELRSLELRAATSWVRWCGGGSSSDEAWRHLAELCAWFPETVTNRDLDEARAVLREAVLR